MCSRLSGFLFVSEKGPQIAWCFRLILLQDCDLGCENRNRSELLFLFVCLGNFEGIQQVRIEDCSDCKIITKKKIQLYFAFSIYKCKVSCY